MLKQDWYTLQNLIEKENTLFKKYIKCSDYKKNILHQEYKTYP